MRRLGVDARQVAAARIREQGTDVFGFGEQKTPESFRQACRRFIYTENLLPEANEDQPTHPALRPPSAAVPLIRKVIAQAAGEDGLLTLSALGSQLSNLSPDFDPRTYGYRKLSDLVRKTGRFEIDQSNGVMKIRYKSQE